ncbi:MAG TPA: glycosyl hydrolase family 8 [Chitinispirillaceae bacterium]|nr:glycosyl hydrolase family 8 [Chitinispirillaceae bacterium]
MKRMAVLCVMLLGLGTAINAQEEINLSGTVKDSKGAAVAGATVTLVSDTLMRDTTDTNGLFAIQNITSIRENTAYNSSIQPFVKSLQVKGNKLTFHLSLGAQNSTLSLFSANGRRLEKMVPKNVMEGVHHYTLPELSTGFYAMNFDVNQDVMTFKLIVTSSGYFIDNSNIGSTGALVLNKSTAAAQNDDTLLIEKEGYNTVKQTINSYKLTDIAIVMDTVEKNGECLFADVLGKTKEECDAKMQEIIDIYFKNGSKLYHDIGSEAYILDVEFDDVRSEGQSYGMMIAVQMDMKDVFDKLWAWSKNHMRRPDGMFNWQCYPNGGVKGQDYAPDGEEWWLMDLLLAARRWNDEKYQREADELSNAMFANGVFSNNLPKFVRNNGTVDPSYILPGFYTLISEYSGNHNSDWANMANAGRQYLAGCVSKTTGLMVGSPTTGIQFDWDAWRTVQCVGLDLLISDLYFDGQARKGYGDWSGSTSSSDKSFITNWYNTYLGFFESKRDDNGGYWPLWTLDGNTRQGDNNQNKTGIRPGLAAMNVYAASEATAKAEDGTLLSVKFAQDLWDMEPPTDDQYIYYDGLLYMLGMLYATGNFEFWGDL